MPRKTGYQSKNALSTLVLGNPELGTGAWETEYDIEYTDIQRQNENKSRRERTQTVRASLRTPRSLKKGYVLDEDYEKLDEQYGQTLSAYRDLQLQLTALEQRVASVQGSENVFLRAVEDQHDLIDTLKQQVSGLTDSLGRLLGGVERNRSLMALMQSVQDAPVAQVVTANKVMAESEVAHRLASLETKIADMADAIATLARAQSLLATRGMIVAAKQMSDGRGSRRPSSQGAARSAERIERLPNPIHLTSRNSSWKP